MTTPDRNEALERSIALLAGDTPTPTSDEAALPLAWDGYCYSRSARAGETLDVFGEPIPPRPIGPGWYIGSLTLLRQGEHDQRGGICVDVTDHPDVNGEAITHYVCVEAHRRHLYRLDIAASDVRLAAPADISVIRRTITDAHNACLPKHRRLAVCDPGWLATTVIPMLHRFEADR